MTNNAVAAAVAVEVATVVAVAAAVGAVAVAVAVDAVVDAVVGHRSNYSPEFAAASTPVEMWVAADLVDPL